MAACIPPPECRDGCETWLIRQANRRNRLLGRSEMSEAPSDQSWFGQTSAPPPTEPLWSSLGGEYG